MQQQLVRGLRHVTLTYPKMYMMCTCHQPEFGSLNNNNRNTKKAQGVVHTPIKYPRQGHGQRVHTTFLLPLRVHVQQINAHTYVSSTNQGRGAGKTQFSAKAKMLTARKKWLRSSRSTCTCSQEYAHHTH